MAAPVAARIKPPFNERLTQAMRMGLKEAPRYLRYLYFLRFSILLWCFPLLLWWANWRGHARALTSGIVTPVYMAQYLSVAFFLIAASLVALVQARVVVINGEERFGEKPPELLRHLLADEHFRHEWIALAASQTNVLILFLYFFLNGRSEGVDPRAVAGGLAMGVALAFCFWYVLTAVYYLTYRPGGAGAAHAGRRALAHTLIFPRRWLFLSAAEERTGRGDVLESAYAPHPLHRLARFLPRKGYTWPDGTMYEGHYFSLLALIGFAGLYAMLWPIAAPVSVALWSRIALALELLGGATVIAVIWRAKLDQKLTLDRVAKQNPDATPQKIKEEVKKREKRLFRWKFALSVLIFGFTIAIPAIYFLRDTERFPILALVLILAISLDWLAGGFAFLADCYRVPVLTALMLLVIVPRVFHWTGTREEHYFSVVMRGAEPNLPTPGQILNERIARDEAMRDGANAAEPAYIVVTSTGGGIHAAAWTAAVLAQLEAHFGGDFHDHVLLLSTVSGGSAGLYTYLRSLYEGSEGRAPDWPRMELEARCSSLEAIGWGLVYHDVPRAIIPVFAPSGGIDDLNTTPLGKDRTWALRRAFERNLNDSFCETANLSVPRQQLMTEQDQLQGLSLTSFPAMGASGTSPQFPAFTMNTTTVEQGSRFLLANYQVMPHRGNRLEPQPAESFLAVYGSQQLLPGHPGYADLPLATAAQLSATFPYVSSAATFPEVAGKESAHFVDGGYYDNDGTASAIEFLREAMDGSAVMKGEESGGLSGELAPLQSLRRNQKIAKTQPLPRLRILLVEIRNSLDPSNPNHVPGRSFSTSALRDDTNSTAWNLVDQLAAPPRAFYAAGHDSVTDRNRNALALLERAYAGRLVLQHFVIDDETNGVDTVSNDPPTDPLNWSLTPAQQAEIDRSIKWYEDKFTQIHDCFAENQECPAQNQEASAP